MTSFASKRSIPIERHASTTLRQAQYQARSLPEIRQTTVDLGGVLGANRGGVSDAEAPIPEFVAAGVNHRWPKKKRELYGERELETSEKAHVA